MTAVIATCRTAQASSFLQPSGVWKGCGWLPYEYILAGLADEWWSVAEHSFSQQRARFLAVFKQISKSELGFDKSQ